MTYSTHCSIENSSCLQSCSSTNTSGAIWWMERNNMQRHWPDSRQGHSDCSSIEVNFWLVYFSNDDDDDDDDNNNNNIIIKFIIICKIHNYNNAHQQSELLYVYSVRRKNNPVNKYHYFRYSSIFFTKFSEIILDTICHYCCKFYRLTFRYLEVAQLWI